MTRSRRLATVALSGAVALTCALPIAPAQAAEPPVGTVRLSSEKRLEIQYLWAGASGFQYRGVSGGSATWVDYPDVVPPAHAGPDDLATGTDVVNTRSGSTVTQKHRSTGATAAVTIPSGQTYKAAVGWSVLTQDTGGALHVLRAAADGTTADVPVTGLPAGAQPTTYVTGGSVRRLAVVHTLDGTRSVGLVDLADGTFRTYVTGVSADSEVVYNDRWLVTDWKSIRVDAEPGTQPTTVTGLPGRLEAVVGDQVLAGNPDFLPVGTQPALNARSLVTGATSTVLSPSFGGIGPTLDGSALATAGPSGLDWNIHRITPTENGGIAAEKVAQIPAMATGAQGLALAGGELFLYGATPGAANRFSSFQLDATGKPTGQQTPRSPALSDPTCLTGDAACPQLEALGDGRVSYLWTSAEGQESVLNVGLDTTTIRNEPTGGDAGGRLPGGTGRYVLYNGGSGTQKVVDFPSGTTDGETVLSRARTAAAVWGQVMWTPGSTQGSVVGKHLKTGQTVATVTTGAPCTPTDIQAVNTWLYWSCGSNAGVYDRATGRGITVPADNGPARLADGFLLRENRTTHELLLTDFHTGTAATRTLVKLPTADQNTGGSNGRWAVDRFGGHIAYLNGTYGEVSIVPSGVPSSPLAQMESQTDAVPGGPTKANPWQPVWQLNKPATWTLTLSNSSGTVIRTLTGSTKGAAVRAAWDGYGDDGRRVTGTYTWKLTAEPRDNEGPALTTTGTTTVN
ncbi:MULTISPECIES: FlgD immunoglobulin-like domain containing protein [unclassified Streptomyces]|uniref:FlgD immunoglobulin-like domain containing protein n=1 Tax=unclassified Streptomyces TaxID=2593676 RepID=UPI00236614FF|nr:MULTISPECIES: FlgD immunoglobulin-like domain containing protein [unclassified Streptomyces]MDF3144974.1 FlgD immunoglobulin-like domain containing protein [Streptomyces sp. T21Q-yed]WDF41529.1 FlgD immunoglobulin-like domain containing protein [Streptomyces sp. T12]